MAAHAACPVVVVRGPEPDSGSDVLRPIVVGVGEPLDCEAAVRFAFEAAAARAVPLVAVHAWRYPVLLVPGAAVLVDWAAVAAEECQPLVDAVARWGKKFPAVRVEQVVVRGDPARELVERSTAAQLVVVGTRGHGSVAGMFLGSVSHALIHHSTCPVAVVRPAVAERLG